MIICNRCGQQNKDNAISCVRCGNLLNNSMNTRQMSELNGVNLNKQNSINNQQNNIDNQQNSANNQQSNINNQQINNNTQQSIENNYDTNNFNNQQYNNQQYANNNYDNTQYGYQNNNINKKPNKVVLIIIIVIIALLCCCGIGGIIIKLLADKGLANYEVTVNNEVISSNKTEEVYDPDSNTLRTEEVNNTDNIKTNLSIPYEDKELFNENGTQLTVNFSKNEYNSNNGITFYINGINTNEKSAHVILNIIQINYSDIATDDLNYQGNESDYFDIILGSGTIVDGLSSNIYSRPYTIELASGEQIEHIILSADIIYEDESISIYPITFYGLNSDTPYITQGITTINSGEIQESYSLSNYVIMGNDYTGYIALPNDFKDTTNEMLSTQGDVARQSHATQFENNKFKVFMMQYQDVSLTGEIIIDNSSQQLKQMFNNITDENIVTQSYSEEDTTVNIMIATIPIDDSMYTVFIVVFKYKDDNAVYISFEGYTNTTTDVNELNKLIDDSMDSFPDIYGQY